MTKHMQAYMYVHMYRLVLVFINMSVYTVKQNMNVYTYSTFYVQCICLCISVFILFYIRPLFAVFNIHTMYKMLYEFKIHYKKTYQTMYKILFKSKFNTSRLLQNLYAYNQIEHADTEIKMFVKPYVWIQRAIRASAASLLGILLSINTSLVL